MSTTDLSAAIKARLASIGTAATTAAEALDGESLDLPEGTLAALLAEVETLGGRLDLVLDRLADALDPAGAGCPSYGATKRIAALPRNAGTP
jgi:hypothetical protein